MGEGVSAEACPGIMTTTMAHAAIDRLMPLRERAGDQIGVASRESPKIFSRNVRRARSEGMTKLPARSLCMLAMNAFVRDKLVLTAGKKSAAVCRSVHTGAVATALPGTNSGDIGVSDLPRLSAPCHSQ